MSSSVVSSSKFIFIVINQKISVQSFQPPKILSSTLTWERNEQSSTRLNIKSLIELFFHEPKITCHPCWQMSLNLGTMHPTRTLHTVRGLINQALYFFDNFLQWTLPLQCNSCLLCWSYHIVNINQLILNASMVNTEI